MYSTKLDRIRQWLPYYYSVLKTRPTDACGFGFLVLATLMTYAIGTFQIIPIVLEDFSLLIRVFGFLIPTWAFVGLLGNLFLIRIHDSSIRNIILMPPVIAPPPTNLESRPDDTIGRGDTDHLLKERTKYIGQQFMNQPFGEDESWHICGACEVYVPPRAWHCSVCKTCILRRDHHCVFTMTCIGEDNHCYFLGLLFYIGFGSSLASLVNLIHAVYFNNVTFWMHIIKSFIPFYTIFFEFSIINILSGINLLGQISAWFVLGYYINLGLKGQTSADNQRGISRIPVGGQSYGISNLKALLGPNPFYKILWPFHNTRKDFNRNHGKVDA